MDWGLNHNNSFNNIGLTNHEIAGRFLFCITGNMASDVHFQAYLLEGLMRWNQDRARAAMSSVDKREPPQSYSVLLRHAANKLNEEVFGKTLVTNFKEPNKYTGIYYSFA